MLRKYSTCTYKYVAVHSTGKYYSSCTLPIYPLSIYARDNPPSAQPRLGVSIEDRPLRGPPPHIDPRIVLGYSCILYYSCSDISGYNSTRCTRPFLCSYYIYGEGVWGEGAGAVDVPGSSRLYRRSNFIMGCAHISASTKTDRPRARPRICSMSSVY